MATKYVTWPVGTKLGAKDKEGVEDKVQWTVAKVEGDAMTLTRTRWSGSLNQAYNGGGTYWRDTKVIKVDALDSTADVIEPVKSVPTQC